MPEDLSAYDGLELRLKGDGRRYKLIFRTSPEWDTVGYTLSFDTLDGQWQSVSGNYCRTCYYDVMLLILTYPCTNPDPIAFLFTEACFSSANGIWCSSIWCQSDYLNPGMQFYNFLFLYWYHRLFFSFVFLWLTVNQNMQLMFSKFDYDGKLNPTFKEGSFQLPVSSIKAYIKDPISPRSILYYLCLEILLLVVLWTVHFYFYRT